MDWSSPTSLTSPLPPPTVPSHSALFAIPWTYQAHSGIGVLLSGTFLPVIWPNITLPGRPSLTSPPKMDDSASYYLLALSTCFSEYSPSRDVGLYSLPISSNYSLSLPTLSYLLSVWKRVKYLLTENKPVPSYYLRRSKRVIWSSVLIITIIVIIIIVNSNHENITIFEIRMMDFSIPGQFVRLTPEPSVLL